MHTAVRSSLMVALGRTLYHQALLLLYRGNRVQCPVCGTTLRRFADLRSRHSAMGILCPQCLSLERHRLLWLFLKDNTGLLKPGGTKTLFHVAPEPCLRKRLEKVSGLRIAVSDLDSPRPEERIDITVIPFDDDAVDCIICSHVLEHVPDDRRAMRELRRVLRPGGWAVINAPVDRARERTFEDASAVSKERRKALFGQEDHVRVYGRDYPDRLSEAGFKVSVIDYASRLGRTAAERFVLPEDEMMYFCSK